MIRARLGAGGLALLCGPACAAWLGCAGAGFELEDLPSDPPLAIVYRSREESERRVEMLERAERPSKLDQGRDSYGRDTYSVRLEDAMDAFGLGASSQERAADLLGHMSWVEPGLEKIHPYAFALLGDRPLDWSDDHSRLMFRSLRHDGVQLFEWSRDSGDVRPLTSGPAGHHSGCYSFDSRLVFSRHQRGAAGNTPTARIYMRGESGGLPQPISPGPADLKPVCSPSDPVVLYETVDPAGYPAIAAVKTDGEKPPQLVARGRDPAFTPDGGWVVYSAQTRFGWRLYQMRPNGTGKRPVGQGHRDEHDPQVSPAGRFVVYVADDEQRQQLRVRSMDGSGDRPLLFHGDGITPVW